MPNPELLLASKHSEPMASGHSLCAGCAAGVIVRQVIMSVEDPVVVANATGCLEVCTGVYPVTSWNVSWIHNAFANVAATLSGVESAYRALRKRGEIPAREIKFVAFGGDGGTYDIGLQSLSGVMERGHDLVYVCYDNGAYMNTGVQRSSATPLGANTSTSPAGNLTSGKAELRKDMTAIAEAHGIPYVAQSSPGYYMDLMHKARRAFQTKGPAFLNVLSPCPLGWASEPTDSLVLARLAVDTCMWPLFEIAKGQFSLTYLPLEKKPVVEWLKLQGRFRHLFQSDHQNLIDQIQSGVDQNWQKILERAGSAVPSFAGPADSDRWGY
ncbi:MAG: pyruvate ferredoxin oxidoreductase [Acidobacteria bacterium]|nr:pyruvate ferredoxin oxidoreductase [Acidobacteriota bacterium]